MYQRKTTVINRTGIHARPASVFVNEAKKFQSNITICNLSLNEQNNTANAKSIIKVLTLALSQGSEVEVSAEGVDEKEAVDTLIELIDSGFGETWFAVGLASKEFLGIELMTYPAVKAFREKGVRNIHTPTGEESMRKREVTNSLPQAVPAKKAQSNHTLSKIAKDRP